MRALYVLCMYCLRTAKLKRTKCMAYLFVEPVALSRVYCQLHACLVLSGRAVLYTCTASVFSAVVPPTHTIHVHAHTHTVIHEPPVDQSTRMGENATFTCVASGIYIKWIIIRNGERCDECGTNEGFWFSKEKFGHSDHEDMYMIVQATVRNNNTQVICQATDHGGVEQSAVLIVQGMILLSRSCVFVSWKQSPAINLLVYCVRMYTNIHEGTVHTCTAANTQ